MATTTGCVLTKPMGLLPNASKTACPWCCRTPKLRIATWRGAQVAQRMVLAAAWRDIVMIRISMERLSAAFLEGMKMIEVYLVTLGCFFVESVEGQLATRWRSVNPIFVSDCMQNESSDVPPYIMAFQHCLRKIEMRSCSPSLALTHPCGPSLSSFQRSLCKKYSVLSGADPLRL
jgi:hypothetical protein